MHTAIIKRIATDAAGRYAVTASGDKTARIWDVASGKAVFCIDTCYSGNVLGCVPDFPLAVTRK